MEDIAGRLCDVRGLGFIEVIPDGFVDVDADATMWTVEGESGFGAVAHVDGIPTFHRQAPFPDGGVKLLAGGVP